MLSFFIVGCVFLQFINVSDAAGMKCVIMLENSEQRGKITEACTKSNKVDEAKLKDFNINTAFEEFDLDDNCFTQCVYKGFNVLTDDGQVNKKETDNLFKGNMTDVMFKKVTSIWTSCIDDVEKMAKDKTNKCKVLALHDFCFNKRMLDDKVHEVRFSELTIKWSVNNGEILIVSRSDSNQFFPNRTS